MTWIRRMANVHANVSLTKSNGYVKSTRLVVPLAIIANNSPRLTRSFTKRAPFVTLQRF